MREGHWHESAHIHEENFLSRESREGERHDIKRLVDYVMEEGVSEEERNVFGRTVHIGDGTTADVWGFEKGRERLCIKIYKKGENGSPPEGVVFRNSPKDEMELQREAYELGVRVPRPVYFLDSDEQTLFIMEKIKGRSLLQIMECFADDERGEDDEVWWKKFCSQHDPKAFWASVKECLLLLHEHGIYHRDLALGNIMVDDETGNPVIIDFGAGRKVSEEWEYIDGNQLAVRPYIHIEREFDSETGVTRYVQRHLKDDMREYRDLRDFFESWLSLQKKKGL